MEDKYPILYCEDIWNRGISMEYIYQMKPSFDSMEREAISNYMNTDGWITEFEKTREFEQNIKEYTGAKYCSVMCNGTLSLTAALIACGVGVGDEVIVPDFTMVATANAVELIGAKAVFVDIDIKNLCLDFEKLEEAVNQKTKAIMLVSINGRYPSRMEDFIKFCKKNNIYLIEDAAQSLGSLYKGKQLGTFGDIGSFSFSAPKIITTGQGGALVTNNEDLYNKIVQIRDFGRVKGGIDHYLIKGWNMKFTDIQAVIGICQMKKLPGRVKRKKRIIKLYYEQLQDIQGITLINTNFYDTTLWFMDILCEHRDKLMMYLKTKKIGTRKVYPALHAEPVYGYDQKFINTEIVAQKGLWLPSFIDLTDLQIEYICTNIKKFYNNQMYSD